MSVFVVACSSSEVRAAELKVAQFHAMFDAGQAHEIYAGADEEFRGATKESEWLALLDKVRTRLGRIEASDERGVDVVHAGGIVTVTLSYATRFSRGMADEEFTFVVLAGDAALRGYRIASELLSAALPRSRRVTCETLAVTTGLGGEWG